MTACIDTAGWTLLHARGARGSAGPAAGARPADAPAIVIDRIEMPMP